MYKGKETCKGCGISGETRPRMSKDSLCYECQEALRIGKALVKEKELERKSFIVDDMMNTFMTWYAIPIQKIDSALRKLLETFSQFDSRNAKGYCMQDNFLLGSAGCGTSNDRFVLPVSTFESAKELCKAIHDVSYELNRDINHYKEELEEELSKEKDKIYNEGVERGRNLLFQLNNNEITPDQFIKPIKKYSK